MRYFITTSIKASFLGVCLAGSLSLNALANTGSAITGDSAGGNPDSSTFTGDIFVPPASSGGVDFTGGGQAQVRPRPKNWTCNLPFKNEESSLRFKTLATMLATNLAGSDFLSLLEAPGEKIDTGTQMVDIPSGPLFSCTERLTSLGTQDNNSNNNTNGQGGISQPGVNSSGDASLLQPAIAPNISMDTAPQPSVNPGIAQPGTDLSAGIAQPVAEGASENNQGIEPSPLCSAPSLSNYLSRPVALPKNDIEQAANKVKPIQDALLALLELPQPPILEKEYLFCGIYDKVKKDNVMEDRPLPEVQALLVQDLVTTLFGLTSDKTLLGDSQGETLVDTNQFAAAIKTYNELINSLTPEQLERWSPQNINLVSQDMGLRTAQDVTATLKMMRSTCYCGWDNRWVDEQTTQSEPISTNALLSPPSESIPPNALASPSRLTVTP